MCAAGIGTMIECDFPFKYLDGKEYSACVQNGDMKPVCMTKTVPGEDGLEGLKAQILPCNSLCKTTKIEGILY